MTLREFISYAEEYWSGMPAPLLEGLTGGLIVMAEAKKMSRDELILGEYQRDAAGSRVVLYYGSFALILGKRERECWREQIGHTIRHELRHHIEARAGRNDLARKEWRERARSRR